MSIALEFMCSLGHSTAVPTSVIGQRFQQVCRDHASTIAVQTSSGGTTFSDLAADGEVIERALADLGIARGDSVISVVCNHPIFFAVVAACMEAGVALVPLGEATASEAKIGRAHVELQSRQYLV